MFALRLTIHLSISYNWDCIQSRITYGLVISTLTSSKLNQKMINNQNECLSDKIKYLNMATIRYWQLIIVGAFLLTIIRHPRENSPYAISTNWFSNNCNILIAWYVIRGKVHTSRKSSIFGRKLSYKYNLSSGGNVYSFYDVKNVKIIPQTLLKAIKETITFILIENFRVLSIECSGFSI